MSIGAWLSAQEKAEQWRRGKAGETISAMTRASSFDRGLLSVIVYTTGSVSTTSVMDYSGRVICIVIQPEERAWRR
jgi:hypothetical protein